MGNGRTSKAAALVEVNLQIREAASDSVAQEQEWEFFCECGALRLRGARAAHT